MSQPPPPPFLSRFAGPPPPRCFPPPPGAFLPRPPPAASAASFFPRGPGPGPSLGFPPPPPPPPPGFPWRAAPEPEPGGEDERWLSGFVSRRRGGGGAGPGPGRVPARGASGEWARGAASGALRAAAGLAGLARGWRRRGEAEAEAAVPAEEAAEAERLLAELRALTAPLREPGWLAALERKAARALRKRLRRARLRREARQAREEEAASKAEREARIDRWRARRAQQVEDKHREQELKAAADSVLSEVRKKQADTKRVAEILRGLEKLRKLRKEAAARKGVCPPPEADEAFENEVQSLRALIKQRTGVYEAEERALRVMLEGEQEEERKRELEKKQRKEKEKLLQQKREMESKLFGDSEEFPLYHLLEPFRQYHLQAEYSVPALIQIRHEWDRFLVPADHPEGSFIPPGWVVPSPPSSDIWTTAVA
ncbi:programmed cell death protein 7 [Paroedura picta]|uniref:programmed cell death protein 7 n=1 Tax=Paroedura picta TaxID=143630 RepID=UPI004057437B